MTDLKTLRLRLLSQANPGDRQLLEDLEQSPSPVARCLLPLLAALDWPGELLQVRNALSGSPSRLDLTDLVNTLTNLGYRWSRSRVRSGQDLPSLGLLVAPNGDLTVLGAPADAADGMSSAGSGGTLYRFRLTPTSQGEKQLWYQAQLLRFRSPIASLYGLSLVINLLALILPFYIRAIYNLEIPGEDFSGILQLLPFALVGVGLQLWLTQRRQERVSGLAARLDQIVGVRFLERLLHLKLPLLQRYSPTGLSSRLKGYLGLNSYVAGPLALVLLDLPYLPIYLVAIASFSPWLMLLTLAIVFLCFGGLLLLGWGSRQIQRPLADRSDLEALQLELVQHLPEIRARGLESCWLERLNRASIDSLRISLPSLRQQQQITILGGEFSQLAGALVLAVGAALALTGDGLQLGTLIAAMFFVWRIFQPIQMAYQALSRWSQIQPSLAELNRFMASPELEEDVSRSQRWSLPSPRGAVEFRAVTLRLSTLLNPALAQLSFKVQPGQLVVIGGVEGAGKSAVLHLLAGHTTPTSGSILLDGSDLRQFPLSQLRNAIGELPANCELMPGTLRDNLLLGNPLADDALLRSACEALALGELLPADGLDHPVPSGSWSSLPPQLAVGMALARLWMKAPPLLLLDEPLERLGPAQRQALIRWLKQRQGEATTLVVSLDPQLLEAADQILLLRDGGSLFQGTPAQLAEARAKAAA